MPIEFNLSKITLLSLIFIAAIFMLDQTRQNLVIEAQSININGVFNNGEVAQLVRAAES